jgi:hypothetical protein
MLLIAESSDFTFLEVVSLVRMVQNEILARFIARIVTKNHEEAIIAYWLTPLGREELRKQQIGDHAIRSTLKLPVWSPIVE